MIDNDKKITYREQRFINLFLAIAFSLFLIAMNTFFISVWLGKMYSSKYDNGITSANAKSVNEIESYQGGGTWLIDESPIVNGIPDTAITFTSNNVQFFRIGSFAPEEIGYVYALPQTYNVAYAAPPFGSGWIDQAYRTVTFETAPTGDLLTWLQSNATPIQSGFSSIINLTNCTCNKSSESGLTGLYTATITATSGYVLTSVSSSLGTITYSNNNKVATISISDVTEDFTISATASLIYHNISYNLGNVVVTSNKPTQIYEISTISITFQPFSNYVLPQYIDVEGVTSYQWDDDTGVLTLSNAFDNVDITINAEYRSGQYTFVELIDSVTLVPVNTFFNLFDFELLGVNIYNLLLSVIILFVIIKILLKVFD